MAGMILAATLAATLSGSSPGIAGPTIDIAELARSWPLHYVLSGTKTEPTYVEHVRLVRDGDRFDLEGGAPAGMAPSREGLVIAGDGTLQHVVCPAAMRCDDGGTPAGFLAGAAIVAALRQGRLSLALQPVPYGGFELVCVPAEALGIRDPILDPCIEIHSGAVLAQRHRLSDSFDGPSLDPWSIDIAAREAASPDHR